MLQNCQVLQPVNYHQPKFGMASQTSSLNVRERETQGSGKEDKETKERKREKKERGNKFGSW